MFLWVVGQAVSLKLETMDLVCEVRFLMLSHLYTGSVASSQKQKRGKGSSLSSISQFMSPAMLTYFLFTAR